MATTTTISKPFPTIGVDKYTFFEVKEDTASSMKYGPGYTLPGTVEIAPTDSGGSDAFDADNGAYMLEAYLENMGHDITNADIPPEVDAMWRGITRVNGALVNDGMPKQIYFGVAWRVLKGDGTFRYVKYFKGGYSFPSHVGGKTKPSSGASEKQTAQANYAAVKTDFEQDGNSLMYMYIDEADALALKGTGETKMFASRAAFEEKWFSDMGLLTESGKAENSSIVTGNED